MPAFRATLPPAASGPRRLLAALAFLALIAGLSASPGAQAQDQSQAPNPAGDREFLPHRGVYALTLAKDQPDFGAVNDARGKLQFDWKDVCDGWSVSQRTNIVVTHRDNSEIAFGWTLNAWEAKDGLSYRFFIKRLLATGETEEVRGSATLKGPGEGGEAVFTAPEEMRLELPPGTVFPTQHSIELLEHVESGSLPFWRVVFDGSGEEGLFGINVALAKPMKPEEGRPFESELLQGLPSWRVSVAYFGMEGQEAEPEYEQEMRLYANGVVDELLLNYGDLNLEAYLADLEALEPDC